MEAGAGCDIIVETHGPGINEDVPLSVLRHIHRFLGIFPDGFGHGFPVIVSILFRLDSYEIDSFSRVFHFLSMAVHRNAADIRGSRRDALEIIKESALAVEFRIIVNAPVIFSPALKFQLLIFHFPGKG